MVKIKCKFCRAVGVRFCTHGKYARKKFITHHKNCKNPKQQELRRKENRLK